MWKAPIRNDALKEKIRIKLADISAALAHETAGEKKEYGLLSGRTGLLLFHSYYNAFRQSPGDEQIEKTSVDIFNHLASLPGYALSNGLTGILWTFEHLDKKGFIGLEEHFFSGLMPSVKAALLRCNAAGNLDYLHGASGIAFYLVDRSETPAFRELDNWIDTLHASGIHGDDTIRWNVLINLRKRLYGNSFGLAHGASSLILILVRCLGLRPNEKARELLVHAVNFMQQSKNEPGAATVFPNHIISNVKDNPSRLAWCHGDLGCAWALYTAGNFLGRDELMHEALEILLQATTQRGMPGNNIAEANFCHGTAGVAHFFSRLYNTFGHEEFREAAEYWFDQTIRLATHTEGLAGYRHFYGEDGWKREAGLLEGIAGIGLSLVSAISEVEPGWDRCLLLS